MIIYGLLDQDVISAVTMRIAIKEHCIAIRRIKKYIKGCKNANRHYLCANQTCILQLIQIKNQF